MGSIKENHTPGVKIWGRGILGQIFIYGELRVEVVMGDFLGALLFRVRGTLYHIQRVE